MKIVKKRSVQGEYAKKGEDIVNGDIVKILSSGDVVTGQYGEQYVFKVSTRNGEKLVNFNQTTLNILHDEFGDESEEWINKEVIIRTKKDVVAGKKVEIYYFVTPNWDFDEWGELQSKVIDSTDKANAEAQIASEADKVEEIPF